MQVGATGGGEGGGKEGVASQGRRSGRGRDGRRTGGHAVGTRRRRERKARGRRGRARRAVGTLEALVGEETSRRESPPTPQQITHSHWASHAPQPHNSSLNPFVNHRWGLPSAFNGHPSID